METGTFQPVEMSPEKRIEIDYRQTASYFQELSAVRFKLLAIVPVVTGAAVAVLGKSEKASLDAPLIIAVGVFGLLSTLGVMFYDQRNTEIYDVMQKRTKMLEALMQFHPWDFNEKKCGGAFIDRPRRRRNFWGIKMWHDRGLNIIYASAMAAWAFLIAVGVTGPHGPVWHAAISAIAVWFLVFLGLMGHDDPTDEECAMPRHIRELIWLNPARDAEFEKSKKKRWW